MYQIIIETLELEHDSFQDIIFAKNPIYYSYSHSCKEIGSWQSYFFQMTDQLIIAIKYERNSRKLLVLILQLGTFRILNWHTEREFVEMGHVKILVLKGNPSISSGKVSETILVSSPP